MPERLKTLLLFLCVAAAALTVLAVQEAGLLDGPAAQLHAFTAAVRDRVHL